MKTKPSMYQKDILSINYDLLKDKGIKALLFDFDNTLIVHKVYDIDPKYIKKIKSLKKDFIIYIVSNSLHSKKLIKISKELDIPFIGGAKKPFKHGYKKLNLNLKPSQIAMIGDQVITDCLGANRMGYYSILIDPINDNEMIFTKINRLLEKVLMKKSNIKRGDYYE